MSWGFYELLVHRPLAVWQSGGISRLLAVGDLLRMDGAKANYRRAISQGVLYGESPPQSGLRGRFPPAISALRSLEEILTRSDLCPVAPDVETSIRQELTSQYGITPDRAFGPDETENLVYRWCVNRRPAPVGAPLTAFDDEPEGAGLERRIWDHLQSAENGQMRAWVHPQAYLGSLFGSNDQRRADFCVCPPWRSALVWEAHGEFSPADRAKSDSMRTAGWDVFDQVAGKSGQREVADRLRCLLPAQPGAPIAPWEQFLVDAPWVASQVDRALAWLLATEVWSPRRPTVTFRVEPRFVSVVDAAVRSWRRLINALESIWGLEGEAALLEVGMSTRVSQTETDGITVDIDPDAPTYFDARTPVLPATFCIRRACFPVDIHELGWVGASAAAPVSRPTSAPTEDSLLVVMQRLFAKPDFRPGQVAAIQHAISGNDCLILLPTGHGKSLVFQVASLLLPGVTLVIEPFRALLDDQERNLQDNGIGRVASIHSGRPIHGLALKQKLLSACMVYVAAERIHIKEFIDELVEVVREKGLDLFIVDEAHTVSQFGHSFRPAYLDLRERLNAICNKAGRERPTTLALTATAAQRVIHDIQALLGISADPVSLDDVAPRSFAREHHEDEIRSLTLSDGKADQQLQADFQAALGTALETLPAGQGIVFCPSKGRFLPRLIIPSKPKPKKLHPVLGAQGIRDLLQQLAGAGRSFGLYTGGTDDDAAAARQQMAQYAEAFSRGSLDVMVATSAFGTGVDLQGVRWTLHVGLPAGLEAYYQESGRAGRDGKAARSVLLVDWDSDDLLDAMAAGTAEDDPIAYLQSRLRTVSNRASLSRQLSLLIGDEAPTSNVADVQSPVYERDESGEVKPDKKTGRPKVAFKPSFPGWKWEAAHVDLPLLGFVLNRPSSGPLEFWCHTWWEDLVWKAVHRLAVLGVVRHGFEHTLKKGSALTAFVLERCDDQDALAADVLVERVVAEVARLTSIERARKARDELAGHMSTATPARRVYLCSAMLLKTVYQVVYETRIESLRSLVRYASEASLKKRREIIEDYFAPSDLKRQVFRLCERPATIEVLREALEVAEAQPRWRSAVFEVAAAEYPGSLVPSLLLAVGGIKVDDSRECGRYLFAMLANQAVALDIRSWCYAQVAARARQAGLLAAVLDALASLMREAPSLSTIEAIVNEMKDVDGETEFGHLLVAEFLGAALEKPS